MSEEVRLPGGFHERVKIPKEEIVKARDVTGRPEFRRRSAVGEHEDPDHRLSDPGSASRIFSKSRRNSSTRARQSPVAPGRGTEVLAVMAPRIVGADDERVGRHGFSSSLRRKRSAACRQAFGCESHISWPAPGISEITTPWFSSLIRPAIALKNGRLRSPVSTRIGLLSRRIPCSEIGLKGSADSASASHSSELSRKTCRSGGGKRSYCPSP